MQPNRDMAARTRGARLEARISVEQKALFQQAAALSARTFSEFVVASAQEAAARIIQTHETIALTRDEQIRFVSTLLAAPAPNERLSQAARQFLAQTGLRVRWCQSTGGSKHPKKAMIAKPSVEGTSSWIATYSIRHGKMRKARLPPSSLR